MKLVAHDLAVGYKAHPVLSEVNLTVKTGEILGIVGPNGAGKTTLLRCLGAISQPASGHVSLDGKDVSHWHRNDLAKAIAYVSQQAPSAFPITVFDSVLMGRRPYVGWRPRTQDLEAVSDALNLIGGENLALRRMDQLSGGERQKVGIARAIAQQAQIMMLDEPTTYLDLHHQLIVLDIVEKMRTERDMGIIMTLHDLNHAISACDSVAVVHDGQVRLCQSVNEINPELVERVYRVECECVHVAGSPVLVPQQALP